MSTVTNIDPRTISSVGTTAGVADALRSLDRRLRTLEPRQGTTLVAGQVTTAILADDAVTGAKIADLAIDGTHIAPLSISTAMIQAGAVNTNQLAALAVTAGKIAADTITSNEIAANAITASEIAAEAVTAAKIKADTLIGGTAVVTQLTSQLITTTNITSVTSSAGWASAGTIIGGTIKTAASGNRVEMDSLGIRGYNGGGSTIAFQINTSTGNAEFTGKVIGLAGSQIPVTYLQGQITETQITDDAITSPKIAANAVTASEIATGAVTADEIKAGAITAGKLAVVSPDQATTFNNGAFNADDIGAGVPITSWTATGGSWNVEADTIYTRRVTPGSLSSATRSIYQDVYVPKGRHVFRVWLKTTSVTGGGAVATGTVQAGTATITNPAAVTGTTEWGLREVVVDVTSEAAIMRFTIGSTSATSGTFLYAFASIQSSVNSTVITPGAITTDKIDANAITGRLVTGDVFKTAMAGARVEMSSTGITALNASGTTTFNLPVSGTNPTGLSATQGNLGILAPATYYYKVTAINNGESLGSNEASVVVPSTATLPAPGQPSASGKTAAGVTSLAAATTYYYKVTALNDAGQTTGSTERSFSTSSLATPTGLAGSAVAGGSLPSSVTYQFKVIAYNSVGSTIASGAVSVATTSTNKQINLTWNAVAGATGYKLYTNNGSGTTFRNALTAGGGGFWPYNNDQGVGNVTSYSFSTISTSRWSGNTLAPTTNTSTPTAAFINWNPVTGATKYRVYRGTATNSQNTYWETTSTSFTDENQPGTAGTVPVTNTAGASSVSVTWTDIPYVQSYRVYRGTAAGTYTGYFVTTANSFLDVGQAFDVTGSVAPPVSNFSSGNPLFLGHVRASAGLDIDAANPTELMGALDKSNRTNTVRFLRDPSDSFSSIAEMYAEYATEGHPETGSTLSLFTRSTVDPSLRAGFNISNQPWRLAGGTVNAAAGIRQIDVFAHDDSGAMKQRTLLAGNGYSDYQWANQANNKTILVGVQKNITGTIAAAGTWGNMPTMSDAGAFNMGAGGHFSGSTFTAPVSGYYRFTGANELNAGATAGRLVLGLWKINAANPSPGAESRRVWEIYAVAGQAYHANWTTISHLGAGEQMYLRGWSGSGTASWYNLNPTHFFVEFISGNFTGTYTELP